VFLVFGLLGKLQMAYAMHNLLLFGGECVVMRCGLVQLQYQIAS
jgi:hypothetical protein